MSTETEREVVGTTDLGEVVVITKQHNVVARAGGVKVSSGDDIGSDVKHSAGFDVRQGGRTILETDDKARAETVAKALVGDAVDQEDGNPHGHLIPTYLENPGDADDDDDGHDGDEKAETAGAKRTRLARNKRRRAAVKAAKAEPEPPTEDPPTEEPATTASY